MPGHATQVKTGLSETWAEADRLKINPADKPSSEQVQNQSWKMIIAILSVKCMENWDNHYCICRSGTQVGVLLPAFSIFSSPKQILVMF